ncbi:MAG: dual specificity protein phosphatase family protein, partial [Acinetobacter sp.]
KQHNFYQISQTVYRSEQPNTEVISELQKNHIDIVINLRNRNKDKSVLADQSFKLIHVPINTWAINRNDLLMVMQTIQAAEQKNQKVLIHCYHGSDRTGASVAMYRIIFENWSIDDALNEMKHGGYGFHPIWVNIEKLFTPENVKWIREQLANPS